jgi:hypothetical protein
VEFEEDLAEKELATEDESQLNKVLSLFNGFLDNKFKNMKSNVSNNSYEETKDSFRLEEKSESSAGDDALSKKKEDLR